MSKIRLDLFIEIALLVSLALCSTAQAQNRVFVSGTGDDLNPCTRTSPCRNFQRGHDVVVSGGEVVAMDSAGYGKVIITKSVSIIGDGMYAGITAGSGNGVTMFTNNIAVNLRSLKIEGLGSGNTGIYAAGFSVLHIENCIVSGFSFGIHAEAGEPGTKKVFIKDSISKNNGIFGITIINESATAMIATVEGTRAENNGSYGFLIGSQGTTVTVRGCLASGNSVDGFNSQVGGVLNIESSVASNNGEAGIKVGAGATVRVSTSTVTNNAGFGFNNHTMNPGTFESRGNNTVAGNNGGGAQTSGTITAITGM